MLHLHDRASMERALTLDLNPALASLLAERIASLKTSDYDLLDCTEFVIIEAGDTEADIVRQIGFSPLTQPMNGTRYKDPDFFPIWDWIDRRREHFEIAVTFGSSFAYLIFVPERDDINQNLLGAFRRLFAQWQNAGS